MDFTQMPVSQGYKYLLIMIDTFTGWMEVFPTRTVTAEEVVKKKKNCSMKSFQDLVCPDHHKVTMGHHLVLRSPKQSKQAKSLSRVRLFATPWAVAYQAPPSMGFFQVRMLEWVAISFSKGSSQTRDQTQVSRIAGRPFTL